MYASKRLKKPPGHTSQAGELTFEKAVSAVTSLKFFFFSPNLTWFSYALVLYYFVPYDIENYEIGKINSTGSSAHFVFPIVPFVNRLLFNFFYIGLYYGFWTGILYGTTDNFRNYLGVRKFTNRWPTAGNFIHDIYYWSLGVIQVTVWEGVMMVIWANTDGEYFAKDSEIMKSPTLIGINFFFCLFVVLYRALHFSVAHRFLHIRSIYKYVHSLHHRDTDPEPFSGLSMHPVEHVYYFSCIFVPTLFFMTDKLSPFVFFWHVLHVSISPGADHSGFEGHFQSGQFHFLHHSKFECNYGSKMTAFIDGFMGTCRDKIGETASYTGEGDKNNSEIKEDGSSTTIADSGLRQRGGKEEEKGGSKNSTVSGTKKPENNSSSPSSAATIRPWSAQSYLGLQKGGSNFLVPWFGYEFWGHLGGGLWGVFGQKIKKMKKKRVFWVKNTPKMAHLTRLPESLKVEIWPTLAAVFW